MNISEKIKMRNQLIEARDAADEQRKAFNREIEAIETEIVETARDAMLEAVDIEGYRYRPKMETCYAIPETKSDHSKKMELLHNLIEMGYGEDVKIFDSGFIDKRKLTKILNQLPVETISAWKAQGILSVWEEPSIGKNKVGPR